MNTPVKTLNKALTPWREREGFPEANKVSFGGSEQAPARQKTDIIKKLPFTDKPHHKVYTLPSPKSGGARPKASRREEIRDAVG